jgi:DNA modification methylase
MNQLYYGDNLQVLREHIPDESVDLIYLDPPFNSKRDYNLLFKTPKGVMSEAQTSNRRMGSPGAIEATRCAGHSKRS